MDTPQRGQALGGAAPLWPDRLRGGLAVELRTTAPGVVRHAALAVHAVSVHAGPPVRVACDGCRDLSVRTRGEINLLPAGLTEEWTEDDPSSSVDLHLAPALVRHVAEDMGLDPGRAGLAPRYHFRDARIEHIAWALEAERSAGFPGGPLYVEGLGLALTAHLLSGYRAPAPPRGGLARPQLERVTDYIEAHLARDVSLARLSRVAGVSASHFKTLFKRSTGLPVHEYVIRRRVERARALLLREVPAADVVAEAGFSHQSHMARCMRRVLGMTPRALVRARR